GNLQINLGAEPGSSLIKRLYYHQFSSPMLDRLREMIFPSWMPVVQQAERAIDKSIRLANIARRLEGKTVFLDTTKNALQIRFLRQRRDINLKLISLVRDGRGVITSLMRHYHMPIEKAISDWLGWIRQQ